MIYISNCIKYIIVLTKIIKNTIINFCGDKEYYLFPIIYIKYYDMLLNVLFNNYIIQNNQNIIINILNKMHLDVLLTLMYIY